MILTRCPKLVHLAAPAEVLNFVFSLSVNWGNRKMPRWLSRDAGTEITVVPSDGSPDVTPKLSASPLWNAVRKLTTLKPLAEIPFSDLRNLTHLAIPADDDSAGPKFASAIKNCTKLVMAVSLISSRIVEARLVSRPGSPPARLTEREQAIWEVGLERYRREDRCYIAPFKFNVTMKELAKVWDISVNGLKDKSIWYLAGRNRSRLRDAGARKRLRTMPNSLPPRRKPDAAELQPVKVEVKEDVELKAEEKEDVKLESECEKQLIVFAVSNNVFT